MMKEFKEFAGEGKRGRYGRWDCDWSRIWKNNLVTG